MELVNHYWPALPNKGGANNSHPLPAAGPLLAEVILQHHSHPSFFFSWIFNGSLLPPISSPSVSCWYSSLSHSASTLPIWHYSLFSQQTFHRRQFPFWTKLTASSLSMVLPRSGLSLQNSKQTQCQKATIDYYKYRASLGHKKGTVPLNILYDPTLSNMIATTTCSYLNLKYWIK